MKIQTLTTDLGMSANQIVNRILDQLSEFEVRQVATFIVEVRDQQHQIPRKKRWRRENRYVKPL